MIDQNGRALYYGIHVNQAFARFVTDNDLNTLQGVQGADPRLFFPAGVVEPTSFPNCFTCHNTQAVTTRGIPTSRDTDSPVLLSPKRINVSHVFSRFVLEETQ